MPVHKVVSKLRETHEENGLLNEPAADCHLPIFEDELQLPLKIEERERSSIRGGASVLVTGANGFVGSFVVAEILSRGEKVVCLVRAGDDSAAKQRMRLALVKWHLWKQEWESQLDVVAGDPGRTTFGLDDASYEALQQRVQHGCVVHCAAYVDLKRRYSLLRKANVLGTIEVLRFCAASSARMIFISTTDLLPRGGAGGTLHKDPEPLQLPPEAAEACFAESGYAASKAVGEALVVRAVARGLPGCIVRLGMVGGALTGVCNPTDFVMRMLIGFSQTRSFPETEEKHTMVSVLPVDAAARALVELAFSRAEGVALNLVSGATKVPMAVLRERLLTFGGPFTELPIIPYKEWIQRVQNDAALSFWPVFGYGASREDFPVFNSRYAPLKAICGHISAETITGVSRGLDEVYLHNLLTFVFNGFNEGVTAVLARTPSATSAGHDRSTMKKHDDSETSSPRAVSAENDAQCQPLLMCSVVAIALCVVRVWWKRP